MEIFKETFFIHAIISGMLIAGLCSFLGVYIILKRIVFIGLALSEIAALGVAIGLFLGWQAEISAIVVTFSGVLFFWQWSKNQKIPNESIIGAVYILAGALSVILVSKNPSIEATGVDLIKGNILYTTKADIRMLALLTVVTLPLHLLLLKELLFVSFDRETAHVTGLNTGLYEFVLYLSVGMVVALSMRVGGILFVFGSLIVPPLISLTLFRKINLVFLFSAIIAVGSVVAGVFISYFLDLPSTPAILCVYGLIFALANSVADT